LIFNLGQQQVFKSQGGQYGGIYCYSGCGPCYGGGPDLGAWEKPFNGDDQCRSWANKSGYNIPLKDGKNMLTNKENGDFTITELEVWEVEYIN
jgi:hypothetical protein